MACESNQAFQPGKAITLDTEKDTAGEGRQLGRILGLEQAYTTAETETQQKELPQVSFLMLGGEGLHVSGHCALHWESDARAAQRFPVPTTTTLPTQSCHPVARLAFLSGDSVGHRVIPCHCGTRKSWHCRNWLCRVSGLRCSQQEEPNVLRIWAPPHEFLPAFSPHPLNLAMTVLRKPKGTSVVILWASLDPLHHGLL